jgi:hypothetical protein
LPDALDGKYPNAAADWRWQWVFPEEHGWKNPMPREEWRHHVDESILQKSFKQAVEKSEIDEESRVAHNAAFVCHTFVESRLR